MNEESALEVGVPEVTVTGGQVDPNEAGTGDEVDFTEPKDFIQMPWEKGKIRAGFTTNKGNGEGKKRRKMAAKSRRINRGK